MSSVSFFISKIARPSAQELEMEGLHHKCVYCPCKCLALHVTGKALLGIVPNITRIQRLETDEKQNCKELQTNEHEPPTACSTQHQEQKSSS